MNTAVCLQEQRLNDRAALHKNVSVFQQANKEYVGLLLNCSDGGMMISSYQPILPGTRLQLELVDIPPHLDTHRKGLCTVEVVWSKLITPSLYGAGCRIEGASDMMTTMIRSYMRG
ncbi:PilZ domain-containing protein [Parathalassolituus penaei]|uniref:PilZ domain-containing protein n=1 Tax=Parathalassolituus penaei TaxID=2997323 RepID=A0A9X3EHA0_9GAMM|nr:PilZ domain-containing protein [Parathalassolituus penaei]MCY0964291.1 PilZ domain-containing protein [Parathalassolituus penaei]